eukprot:1162024-Pelagomonas_calceolata.AAC.5
MFLCIFIPELDVMIRLSWRPGSCELTPIAAESAAGAAGHSILPRPTACVCAAQLGDVRLCWASCLIMLHLLWKACYLFSRTYGAYMFGKRLFPGREMLQRAECTSINSVEKDTCGRVLMGLLCHASTRISTTTSHMLLTHAVCLESEAAQLVCGNASVRRGMADALAAAALALGVPKQEVASSLSSLPQGAPDPPLIRASFEVGADGEAAVSGVSTAEGKAAALQQLQARGGKEEGGSELRRSKRWQALEAKAQGSDPLERLQRSIISAFSHAAAATHQGSGSYVCSSNARCLLGLLSIEP